MRAEAHQKVTASHLKRDAYLYVRQSTLRQVFENTESTTRQYALRERAVALGWPVERVVTIDSDLGQSAASAADREGSQKLVADVTLLKDDEITAHVRFKGSATRTLTLPLPRGHETNPAVLRHIDELLEQHTDAQIAFILNQRGVESSGGQPFNRHHIRDCGSRVTSRTALRGCGTPASLHWMRSLPISTSARIRSRNGGAAGCFALSPTTTRTNTCASPSASVCCPSGSTSSTAGNLPRFKHMRCSVKPTPSSAAGTDDRAESETSAAGRNRGSDCSSRARRPPSRPSTTTLALSYRVVLGCLTTEFGWSRGRIGTPIGG